MSLDKVKLGDSADAILNHPLITEALNNWEQEIIEAWKKSSQSDADAHRNLKSLLEASNRFRKYLNTAIQTGKLIKATPTKMERVRSAIGIR